MMMLLLNRQLQMDGICPHCLEVATRPVVMGRQGWIVDVLWALSMRHLTRLHGHHRWPFVVHHLHLAVQDPLRCQKLSYLTAEERPKAH